MGQAQAEAMNCRVKDEGDDVMQVVAACSVPKVLCECTLQ